MSRNIPFEVSMNDSAGPSGLNMSRGVKRLRTTINKSIPNTVQDLVSDYLCPICMDLIKEAHLISCGHTFCRECLEKNIETTKRCPKCNYEVYSASDMIPNHLVDKQVTRYQKSLHVKNLLQSNDKKSVLSGLKDLIEQNDVDIEVCEISDIISLLQDKKDTLLSQADETKYKLLTTFLGELKKKKENEVATINRELQIISHDLSAVQNCLDDIIILNKHSEKVDSIVPNNNCNISVNDMDSTPINSSDDVNIEGFNVPGQVGTTTSFEAKKKRIHLHFDELVDNYFFQRSPVLNEIDTESTPELDKNLDSFGDSMRKFTQFSNIRSLATIDYAGDKFPTVSNSSNIASSIEFDKDGEYFAVAGLTKKIRIFDYGNVIKDVVDIHYPSSEMVCDAKVSCISWGSYLKNKLASSDYDGDVTVWDAFTSQKLHVYKEHQKRCWSVDFNKMDTKLLASGSDDSCVKLWHLDSERSLTSLTLTANVCCVQFNPESRYHLAFGSADHCVHYYDLRNMKEPLKLFKGHKKAVSYVKFMSRNEIVSASTDSQLKVWNVDQTACVQSLTGHVNEKHFVGLATDGEFVACGSENNSLYVYYKGLPKKLLSFKFDPRRFVLDTGDPKDDDNNDFVSAVCWHKNSNVLVAGNSQGMIKVLMMT